MFIKTINLTISEEINAVLISFIRIPHIILVITE